MTHRYETSNSFFDGITNSGSGGVIHIHSPNVFLSVTTSVFSSCSISHSTSNFGGAIYLSSQGGECCIFKCCALNCFARWGQFLYASLETTTTKFNNISHSSMINCPNNFDSQTYRVIYQAYGDINQQSLNFSKCLISVDCITDTGYDSRLDAFYFNVYDSFGDATIYFLSCSDQNLFHDSNIINNSRKTTNFALFLATNSNIYFSDLIVLYNYDITLFSTLSSQFHVHNFYSDLSSSVQQGTIYSLSSSITYILVQHCDFFHVIQFQHSCLHQLRSFNNVYIILI